MAPSEYGSIRLYVALSWGLTHILIGFILDFIAHIQYTLYLSALMTVPCCFCAHKAFAFEAKQPSKDAYRQLSGQLSESEQITGEEMETKVSVREFVRFVIAKPSTLSLYFLMFSMGGAQSVATNMIFPWLFDLGTEKYSTFLYSLLVI